MPGIMSEGSVVVDSITFQAGEQIERFLREGLVGNRSTTCEGLYRRFRQPWQPWLPHNLW